MGRKCEPYGLLLDVAEYVAGYWDCCEQGFHKEHLYSLCFTAERRFKPKGKREVRFFIYLYYDWEFEPVHLENARIVIVDYNVPSADPTFYKEFKNFEEFKEYIKQAERIYEALRFKYKEKDYDECDKPC